MWVPRSFYFISVAQSTSKFSSQILLHQEQHQRPKRSVRSIVSHRANIFNISNAPFEVDSKQKFPHSWVRSARGLHALHKFKARGRSTSPRREREDPRECLMRSGARNGLCLLISALILGNVRGGWVLESGNGQCAVDRNCFASLNYDSFEVCKFRADGISGILVFSEFETETDVFNNCGRGFDFLTMGGSRYCNGANSNTPPSAGIPFSENAVVDWETDRGSNFGGFRACLGCAAACAAGSTCSSEGSTATCVSCPGEKRQRTKWRK